MIADPPSYQKGSFVATKDYARLLRGLPGLLAPGGYALLCLNAPELPMAWLNDLVREHAPDWNSVERVPNPLEFADVDEGRGLKVLVYRAAWRGDLSAALDTLNGAGDRPPESDDRL